MSGIRPRKVNDMAPKKNTEVAENATGKQDKFEITITLGKREYHRLKSAADFLGLTPQQAVESMVKSKLSSPKS